MENQQVYILKVKMARKRYPVWGSIEIVIKLIK